MTESASKLSGKIIADLERSGKILEFRDIFIAGIVVTNNLKFFTRNVKHFGRIKDLIVKNLKNYTYPIHFIA